MRPFHVLIARILPRGLIAAAALGAFSLAHAGYAQVTPPAGFSGSAGAWRYTAANSSQFISNTVRTVGSLSVAGKNILVPVGLRLAANTAVYTAKFAYANPLLLGAAAVTAIAAAYIYWDSDLNQWVKDPPSKLRVKEQFLVDRVNIWMDSAEVACEASAKILGGYVDFIANGRCYIKYPFPGQSWPAISEEIIKTRTYQEVEDIPKTPLSEPDFTPYIEPLITPQTLPDWIPAGQPIPVADPIINPSSDPSPLPQPLLVPIGDPIPLPNPEPANNPQQYSQPFIRIAPSPTATDPWRVDLQPVDRITNSPTPVTDPLSQSPDSTGNTKPSENSDLCALHPDILACAKPELDTPTAEIPRSQATLAYQVDEIIGSGGSCPSAVYASVGGHQVVAWNWPLYCGWITAYARPVLLAVASFMSLMIVAGGFKTE